MPIVVPAVSCHPDDLMSRLPDDVPERRWMVACTMPRQEKSLARDLFRLGIPFYLPLLPKVLFYKGRSAKSYLPLFSGFVFLYAGDEERAAALATGRITTILDVADQEELHNDLTQVEVMLNRSRELAAATKCATAVINGKEVGNSVSKNHSDGNGNGKHLPPEHEERQLVLSVRFLRQNIMIEGPSSGLLRQ